MKNFDSGLFSNYRVDLRRILEAGVCSVIIRTYDERKLWNKVQNDKYWV